MNNACKLILRNSRFEIKKKLSSDKDNAIRRFSTTLQTSP